MHFTLHPWQRDFMILAGWVYCLRMEDGTLIWRFRAAPMDKRLIAYEQVESLWPVHGSVLIHEDDALRQCVQCGLDSRRNDGGRVDVP